MPDYSRDLENEQDLTVGRAGQEMLLAIHQHLRQELGRLQDVIVEVRAGRSTAAEARSYLNAMTMRRTTGRLARSARRIAGS